VTGSPRLLALIGSGETSPTMVRVHRELLARLGPPPVPAVLLDTPFGFQENADDIARRALTYFAESVGHPMQLASFRSATESTPLEHETMLARLREARYVFAGPGSPSYALRQWSGSLVPRILREKLAAGGCLAFASAAALALGVVTVPVYEIYKVGAPPHWLDGLNLLAETGLTAAVIPHYDNAEGGTHDTRFCYLGERRLAAMEQQLPGGAFVLGIDEHTACILDLGAGTASISGLGVVTVRVKGRSAELPAGETVPIDELNRLAAELGGAVTSPGPAGPARGLQHPAAPPRQGTAGALPLLTAVRAHQTLFSAALDRADMGAAVSAVLALDAELAAWAADTLESDQLDQGRATLRSMIVRLGELTAAAASDPRQAVAPLVEALLEVRDAARAERRWSEADSIRDRLLAMGIQVNDGPEGTTWDLAG
jgi:hypothetical protein